jgi:hypothetical protein
VRLLEGLLQRPLELLDLLVVASAGAGAGGREGEQGGERDDGEHGK